MKATVLVAAVIAGLGAAFAPSVGFGLLAGDDDATGQAAIALIERLAEGRFDLVVAEMDSSLTRRLGPDSLAPVWERLVEQVGPISGTGPAAPVPLAGLRAVDVPVEFARARLVARVTYDARGRVVGLAFRPLD